MLPHRPYGTVIEQQHPGDVFFHRLVGPVGQLCDHSPIRLGLTVPRPYQRQRYQSSCCSLLFRPGRSPDGIDPGEPTAENGG